jgi:hypothetical protein
MRAGLHPLNPHDWLSGDHHLHAFASGSSGITDTPPSELSDEDEDDDDDDGLSLVSEDTEDGD